MRMRPILAAAGAVCALSGVVGCGSGTAPSSGTGPSAAPLNSSAASPTAGATESNPAGDIPDNQAYVGFTPPGATFVVKVPEGWARSTSNATTTFSDKLNQIAVVQKPDPNAPTVTSVKTTEVDKLRAAVPKFAPGSVTSVVRSAGPAILTTYQGDSAQDPVTGKVVRDAFERYTFYRAGQRVDLTLSGPVNADNVDPWKIVSDSLRWIQ